MQLGLFAICNPLPTHCANEEKFQQNSHVSHAIMFHNFFDNWLDFFQLFAKFKIRIHSFLRPFIGPSVVWTDGRTQFVCLFAIKFTTSVKSIFCREKSFNILRPNDCRWNDLLGCLVISFAKRKWCGGAFRRWWRARLWESYNPQSLFFFLNIYFRLGFCTICYLCWLIFVCQIVINDCRKSAPQLSIGSSVSQPVSLSLWV